MKKSLFMFLALTATYFGSQAQDTRFGVQAGAAFANYNAKSDGQSDNGSTKVGLTLGLVVHIPVSEHFVFEPAVNFVQKGFKQSETINGETESIELTTNHIEIPFNFVYNSATQGGAFFIGAGPSLALGMSGKWKYKTTGTEVKQTVNFGSSDDDDLKGFDLGVNVLAGYRLPNGLFIAANYNAGLSNLAPGGDNNNSLKSSYFGIRIGYLFNKKAAAK